jgi:hypothetical protein
VVVEISYNIQAAVDNKHNLVVATHTINRNDLNALGRLLEAKENLEVETLTVLVDKGYHGREIAQCKNNNIITIVAHPTQEELKTALHKRNIC